jgi:hypothetical protein
MFSFTDHAAVMRPAPAPAPAPSAPALVAAPPRARTLAKPAPQQLATSIARAPAASASASVAPQLPPSSDETSSTKTSGSAQQAEARLAAGDADGALTIARVARLDATAASLRAWARAAWAAGRPVEAHDACLAWLAAMGGDSAGLEPRILDAKSLRAAGRDDDARERLEETLRRFPGCDEARAMLRDLELVQTGGGAATRRTKRSAGGAQKVQIGRRG